MNDLIRRSDAIEEIARRDTTDGTVKVFSGREVADILNSMPSAQPVITCDGCKFVGTYDTDFPCRNCIRREKDYYAKE